MASVIDFVMPGELKKLEPGAVVPIDRHRSTARGLWSLGGGGSLYLLAKGDDGALWLVAILEAPEQSQIKPGDRRARGWYAPANVTPITQITAKLPTGRVPRALKPHEEAMLRELVDEVDTPIMETASRDSAVVVEGPPLVRAAAYLAAGAIKQGIAAMLEAWRESRAVELADLIDRASRCLPSFDRPLFVDRVDARSMTKTWMDVLAADPVGAMPQLLRNLRAVEGVLEELAELPDDPRVSRRLVALIHTFAPAAVVPIIERGRDAVAWSALAALAPEVRIVTWDPDDDSEYQAPIGETTLARSGMAKFASKSPGGKLGNGDRAHVDGIAAAIDRLEEVVRTECDLVDGIADDWESDGPRSIYADWLIERGHPRGEYLSLMLKKEKQLSPAQRRRLALLADVPYLYGALDDVATMQRRKRDRGIDRSLDIYWSTTPLMWSALAQAPLVRALEQIRLVGEPRPNRADALATFIRAAPRLATVDEIDEPTAKAVVDSLRGWKHEPKKERLVRR